MHKVLTQYTREDGAALCQSLLMTSDVDVITSLLHELRADRVTAPLLLGFIDVCRQYQTQFEVNDNVIDIVGTGGDGKQSLNISTAASLIIAACGQPVLKHGNRASTSKVGSADYLQKLGLPMYRDVQEIKQALHSSHYAYCYAPYFLSRLQLIGVCRRQLSFPTIFNLIGPCLNPGHVKRGVIGVYSPQVMDVMAETMAALDMSHVLLVHGSGFDELNAVGLNQVIEICNGSVQTQSIDPVAVGLSMTDKSVLQGQSAEANHHRLQAIMQGNLSDPAVDTLVLNAGAGLFVGGMVDSINLGVEMARSCLESQRLAVFIESLGSVESEVDRA